MKYSVVIIGGGISGSIAAIACARSGVSTLLIEETGCLGGCMTSCGTGPMMTFHAGELQVIRGIPDELVQRLKEKGLSPGHIIDSTGYTYTVTPFDSEGMKYELDSMTQEAGVKVLYHSVLSSVEKDDSLIKHIDVISCGDHIIVEADIFIDATGDGDLIHQAGLPYQKGRAADGKNQPMTMNMKLSNVNINAIRELMDQQVELFPFLKPKAGIEKKAPRLSCSGFQEIMREGLKNGEISFDRDIVLFFETNRKNEVIVNMSRVNDLDPVNPEEISRAEVEGRKQIWQLYHYLKKAVPGFSDSQLISSGPNIGIRSSRRLIGNYSISADDILRGEKFPDGIAACGYPIDIHSSDGCDTDSTFLKEGSWYTVPYRCLTNSTIHNLLATGRLISCTFEAQASLRVSPCCGALGQAAGTAAALSIQNGCPPLHLDAETLINDLKQQGAFLN